MTLYGINLIFKKIGFEKAKIINLTPKIGGLK